tara:strand:+ start:284 stop:823 length:540 start_codon:yes stop_codon:yes gene_type:complete
MSVAPLGNNTRALNRELYSITSNVSTNSIESTGKDSINSIEENNILNSSLESINNDECIICLDKGNLVTNTLCTNNCKFKFHVKCYADWLVRSNQQKCLVCKENLLFLPDNDINIEFGPNLVDDDDNNNNQIDNNVNTGCVRNIYNKIIYFIEYNNKAVFIVINFCFLVSILIVLYIVL